MSHLCKNILLRAGLFKIDLELGVGVRWGGSSEYAPQGWPVKIDLEFGGGGAVGGSNKDI
jgi:hypothetical protein